MYRYRSGQTTFYCEAYLLETILNMPSKTISEQNLKRLKYISLFLKNMRLNDGLTQQEVANQTNLHRNTISRIENTKNITLFSLMEMCDLYGISMSELFFEFE
jgi:DNA-binding XRE family transcriptional regulator